MVLDGLGSENDDAGEDSARYECLSPASVVEEVEVQVSNRLGYSSYDARAPDRLVARIIGHDSRAWLRVSGLLEALWLCM